MIRKRMRIIFMMDSFVKRGSPDHPYAVAAYHHDDPHQRDEQSYGYGAC